MKKKIRKKPVLIFLIAVIALYVVIYIVPTVTGALVSSYVVEYGELKTEDNTTGYFVRNEKVYLAGETGKTNVYIKEGTLVRRGTAIMEVSASGDGSVASKYEDLLTRLGKSGETASGYKVNPGGVVSYYADGYEGKLTPTNMEKENLAYYSKLSQDDVLDLSRKKVSKGEPVFKIVDRTKWYLVCYIDKSSADRYAEGDSVTVEFEDDSVETTVYSIKNQDGKTRVILESINYYKKFAQLRNAQVSLVTADTMGLIIENSSITEKKGVKGVYVKNKTNDYNFVPIQVIATNGEKSIVSKSSYYDAKGNLVETIDTYDEVLKKPN